MGLFKANNCHKVEVNFKFFLVTYSQYAENKHSCADIVLVRLSSSVIMIFDAALVHNYGKDIPGVNVGAFRSVRTQVFEVFY